MNKFLLGKKMPDEDARRALFAEGNKRYRELMEDNDVEALETCKRRGTLGTWAHRAGGSAFGLAPSRAHGASSRSASIADHGGAPGALTLVTENLKKLAQDHANKLRAQVAGDAQQAASLQQWATKEAQHSKRVSGLVGTPLPGGMNDLPFVHS